MTHALALPSLRRFYIALAGLCFSLALFFGVAIDQAHAASLTDAQVQALADVVSAFGNSSAASVADANLHAHIAQAQAPAKEELAAAEVTPLAPSAAPVPPTCALIASANSVASGDSVTLSWSSTNAIYASMPGGDRGPAQGSLTETPTQSTAYQKTVYGPGGSATCDAIVTVLGTGPALPLQASVGQVDLMAASVEGLNLVDNIFSPDDLVAASATVAVQDYDLLVEAFTQDFIWVGMH